MVGSSSRRSPLASVVGILAVRNVVGPVLPAAWYVSVNASLSAALVALMRGSGVSCDELGLARRRLGSGLGVGAAAGALAVAGLALAAHLPATRRFFDDERVVVDAGAGELASQVLVRIPVGTVVFEEVAFRGVLLALLAQRLGTRRAVVIDSALFGLWHIVPTTTAGSLNGVAGTGLLGAVAGSVVVTGVGGVVFCALRLRSGHLAAPVLAHLAINVTSYSLSWLVRT